MLPADRGLQYDSVFRRLLTGIEIGRKFRQPEDVHHAVIADAITRTEFLMRVVIEGAPANRTGHATHDMRLTLNAGVAQRMFDAPLLAIERLGGEHMPVELGDEMRRLFRLQDGLREVVKGIDIFQEFAAEKKAHAAGRSGGIKLPREHVRHCVKVVVIP